MSTASLCSEQGQDALLLESTDCSDTLTDTVGGPQVWKDYRNRVQRLPRVAPSTLDDAACWTGRLCGRDLRLLLRVSRWITVACFSFL